MSTDQLYVNGTLVDLPADFVMAITRQNYCPLTPDKVLLSFSNTFKLPPTSTNRLAFGLLDSVESLSQVYKAPQPCRFVRGGIEIIPNGFILVTGTSDGNFNCVIYSNLLDIYTRLKSKLLIDLDYTDVNQSFYTDTDWYDFLDGNYIGSDVGKVFAAVIDGGYNLSTSGANIVVNHPWLMYGYKQMLIKIIEQAGYGYSWTSLTSGAGNEKFRTTALTEGHKRSHLQYSERFQKSVIFTANKNADQTLSLAIGASGQVTFPFTRVGCAFWDSTISQYTVVNPDTALTYFNANFAFIGKVNLSTIGGNIDVNIVVNGTAVATINISATGDTDVSSVYNGSWKDGDVIEVKIKCNVAACTVKIYQGAEFFLDQQYIGQGAYVYFNEYLEETITQLDLFKDFLFRFGQIPKESNGTMYFKSIVDILYDAALGGTAGYNDWTGKRDEYRPDESEFSLTELAQSNVFRHTIEDVDSDVLAENYGEGSYDLDDTTLVAEKVMTSIFSASQEQVDIPINCARIAVETAVTPGNVATNLDAVIGKRILLARPNDTTNEPPVVVGGSAARATYMVGCFTKRTAPQYFEESLSFQNALDEWYKNYPISQSDDVGFLARLKNAKWVTRYYKLTDGDFWTYDDHKPIIDGNTIFMFPTFYDFVAGRSTKVRMLKI